MNRYKIIIPAILLVLSSACTNDPDKQGNSTSIDSSNIHGTAPATYGGDNPANPDPPRYEGQFDTGMQSNTMSSEDSMNTNKK